MAGGVLTRAAGRQSAAAAPNASAPAPAVKLSSHGGGRIGTDAEPLMQQCSGVFRRTALTVCGSCAVELEVRSPENSGRLRTMWPRAHRWMSMAPSIGLGPRAMILSNSISIALRPRESAASVAVRAAARRLLSPLWEPASTTRPKVEAPA